MGRNGEAFSWKDIKCCKKSLQLNYWKIEKMSWKWKGWTVARIELSAKVLSLKKHNDNWARLLVVYGDVIKVINKKDKKGKKSKKK
jgi:hypothetical protein